MRLVLIILVFLPSGVFADRGNAAAWLMSNQNPDGSWGNPRDGEDSLVYCTSVVIQALKNMGIDDNKGIEWIKARKSNDTGALAKTYHVLKDERLLEKLDASQNNDGGWGKSRGYKSTSWYTSIAVLSLVYSNISAAKRGGNYLAASQSIDGGWSNSSLATSSCVYAMAILYNTTREERYLASALNGVEWLALNPQDGVYPLSGSILAYGALYSLLREERLRAGYEEVQQKLLESQNKNGSWGYASVGDPLSTGWALSALTTNFSLPPAEPSIFMNFSLAKKCYFAGGEVEAVIRAENRGAVDIKGLEFKIEIPELKREIMHPVGPLKRGENRDAVVKVPLPSDVKEDAYKILVYGKYNAANYLQNFSALSESTFSVIECPLKFEMHPLKLKNYVSEKFSLLVKNGGSEKITIQNVSLELDENWGEVEINRINGDVLPKSEGNFEIFRAVTPQKIGEYRVGVILNLYHPLLGDIRIFHNENLVVGSLIHSGLLKLILYSTGIFSVFLLLNLVLGLDLVE